MVLLTADRVQVLTDFVKAELLKQRDAVGVDSSAAQRASAPELPRVVRAFLQAQSQLSRRTAVPVPTSFNQRSDGPKVLRLRTGSDDQDYLNSKCDEMQLTIVSLQDELHQQQLLLQDSQYRAQRLEEVLQQSSQEYEQLLQLSAEQIESLKVEFAERMQQATTQELETAQRSLQLRDEYEPAIAAEMKRLEKLGQQLQKQQQLLQQERAEIQAQRSAIQIQTSTAEAALSSVAQQQATMLVQHSQLSANSDDAKTRWELQQVESLSSSLRNGYVLISRLNCSNGKPKRYSAFKLT